MYLVLVAVTVRITAQSAKDVPTFQRNCYLHLPVRLPGSSETFVLIYITTWHQVQEDSVE
jgi:hypothetical protein